MITHVINMHHDFIPFFLPEAAKVSNIDYPSGCEPHVRLWDEHSSGVRDILVTARIKSSDDVIRLVECVDAARTMWHGSKVSVFIPYMPHARQDRVAVAGDAFSLKVMTSIIVSSGAHKLHVFDLHNPDAEPRICNHDASDFYASAMDKMEPLVISPDKGFSKRLDKMIRSNSRFAGLVGDNILHASKERNPTSGSLVVTPPDSPEIHGRNCFILDDICDGGGTFIPIAASLKEQGAMSVTLVVSHGLFTKGTDALRDAGIDKIVTTNSFYEAGLFGVERVSPWSMIREAITRNP